MSGTFRLVPDADFGPFSVVPAGKAATFEIAANAADDDPLGNGRPGPEIVLPEPEQGGTVSLSSLRGKPVVLCFFCGCAWCEAVAEKFSKPGVLPPNAQVVAVLNEESLCTPAGARKFRERTGFTGRLLGDATHEATLVYGSSECPRVWALDGEGIIRHVNASRTEGAERIVAEAVAALGVSGGG